MIVFPANPTSISKVCRNGKLVALLIQHPLLDAPIRVPLDQPDRLTWDDLETYRQGHLTAVAAAYGPGATVRAFGDTGRLTLDLAANITDALRSVGLTDRDAHALPEIWEDCSAKRRTKKSVGPINPRMIDT